VTTPELSPEEPRATLVQRLERMVEATVVALVVLLAALLGLPELVESVREGSVELATVFYPVMLVAFGVLAWTRRAGE
jgi:hypothetical protein